ncbi:acetyl-CoA acetyltransferase [Tropicimonas isoalkanivorans]|uniref:Acetyl-CoA acetyltransferase n=1 Tax=Tropicimonas isoalkanivorans TaxID=441112 RepID=A0A1I1HZ86_9RHOB|nr:acetyl-CoA acetyltransferase [Tropicimonas isoalkanivorans]SFC27278.1 Acetyl-CoA acetyltransferase [Tropicimonas isoalkanivorans]
MGFPRGKSAFVSGATFGIGEAPGYSDTDLAAHAVLDALEKVNLRPGDIDGLFAAMPSDPFGQITLAQYMGIYPKILEGNRTGGSSFQTHAHIAAHLIASGEIETAVIAYGSNQRSAAGGLVSSPRVSPYQAPYRPMQPISSYALAASRHMHEYGTTKEQLAEVAVAARKWANLNPDAFMQGNLSVDEVVNARIISSPLGKFDCCLVTDGAAAVVMTSADRAKDIVNAPAYLLGAGQAATHWDILSMPDLTATAAAESGKRAFAAASVTPDQIDVVELYDAFTINTILFLEDLGFCPKGEGGRFVEGGAIAPGGQLAVNTNGGGLSCVHPGMYGLFVMYEAIEQIMGTAGKRQQADVNLAVAHGNGGTLSSQATLILGSEATL